MYLRVKTIATLMVTLIIVSCSSNNPTEPKNPIVGDNQIKDLVCSDSTYHSITVSWTSIGEFVEYEMRYSFWYDSVIAWENTQICDSMPTPSPMGERQSVTIDSLCENTRYYIGIRAIDINGDTTELHSTLKAYTASMFEHHRNYYYSHNLDPRTIITTDVNNDNIVDVLVSDINGESIVIYHGDGTGEFGLEYHVPTSNNPVMLYPADFNNDNYVDFAISHAGADKLSVMMNDGTGQFSTPIILTNQIVNAYAICTGDFNSDSYDDIVFASDDSMEISLMFNNQVGGFNLPIVYATAERPNFVLAEDFNNDSHLDLAVSNRNSFSVGIYFNNGDGTLRFDSYYGARMFPDYLCSADFDQNGFMDIGIAVPPHAAILYNEGNGVFGQVCSTFAYIGHHETIYAADLNNDNTPDLVLADYDRQELTIIYNEGNRVFSEPVYHIEGIPGKAFNVSSNDFDLDGDEDLFLAALGGRAFTILKNIMVSENE